LKILLYNKRKCSKHFVVFTRNMITQTSVTHYIYFATKQHCKSSPILYYSRFCENLLMILFILIWHDLRSWRLIQFYMSIQIFTFFNTRTAEKKKSRTAEEGKFTLYLYIRFYTR